MLGRELYLNLSKYVDTLLVGKSVIDLKHFSSKILSIDRLLVSLIVIKRDFTNVILVYVILLILFY